jgi:hypothetical protein
MKRAKIPDQLQKWIRARQRHKLSHAHVQMARELGLNPHKLGKLGNHKQEPWKLPLPQFIEEIYFKSFGKPAPDAVVSIEERARQLAKKKAERKAQKAARRFASQVPAEQPSESPGESSASEIVPF